MNKRTYIFVLSLLTTVLTYGQKHSIKLDKGERQIKTVLKQIQEQCPVIIFYSDEVLTDAMRYDVPATDMELQQLMQTMLSPYRLDFKNIDDKVIAIYNPGKQPTIKSQQTIQGLVVDTANSPIEFANIRLFDEQSRLVAIYSTDTKGVFTIQESLKADRKYSLQLSALGYKPQKMDLQPPYGAPLQKMVLQANEVQIKTVHVKAMRRPFERVADRLIVQVEGSVLESGLSTLDILQRSPGIWVDPNGGIRLRGNQSVQVMINDMIQRMSSEQLAEYLRSLPSESISKIEIIPNPAAEYEASGTAGIIRIVLRKNTLDGFRVNLLARYLQQVDDPYYNVGTIVDFKKNKLTLTAVAGYLRNDEYIFASNDISYADQSTYTSSTDRYRESKSYNGRITASYDLADNHSLGFQTILTNNHTDQNFYTDNAHFDLQDTVFKTTFNNWLTRPRQLSSTLNYSWKRDSLGSSVRFLADYVNNKHREENHYTLREVGSSSSQQYINYSPNQTSIYSIQTDWTQYYKHSFNWLAGLKYIGTDRNNEVLRQNLMNDSWIKDDLLSNEFLYKEDLVMGYAAFNYKLDKLSAKIGLRGEKTIVDALSLTSGDRIQQDYFHLFPSIFLQREIGNQHSLILNYAKRINRPSFKNLNPYTLQIDDFILIQGNADLKPEIMHRVEGGIQLKNNISLDLFYSYTKDKIAQFTETKDNSMLVYQSRNFAKSTEWGSNLFVPWKLNAWWSGQANATWFQNVFRLEDEDLNQQTFETSLNQYWKVKKWFDASLHLSYSSPRISANTRFAHQFYSSLTLSKRLAKDKAKITFHLNDIFNTAREREWTERKGAFVDFYQKRPTRTFGLSFTYVLSKGKKIEDKKIEESNKEAKSRAN